MGFYTLQSHYCWLTAGSDTMILPDPECKSEVPAAATFDKFKRASASAFHAFWTSDAFHWSLCRCSWDVDSLHSSVATQARVFDALSMASQNFLLCNSIVASLAMRDLCCAVGNCGLMYIIMRAQETYICVWDSFEHSLLDGHFDRKAKHKPLRWPWDEIYFELSMTSVWE